jgi:hypothetical protein
MESLSGCLPNQARHTIGRTFTRTTRTRSGFIERIGGELQQSQERLVEAWAELHRAELLENWNRLQAGKRPLPSGADFDPAVLHDWPVHASEMKRMAKRWKAISHQRRRGAHASNQRMQPPRKRATRG